MRRRSLIEWDEQRDRELLAQLEPFKARARGRRLKELALLGLLAERAGCRVSVDRAGQARLEGLSAPLVLVGGMADPAPAAPTQPTPTRTQPAALSSEHEAGLEALLGNVVGF